MVKSLVETVVAAAIAVLTAAGPARATLVGDTVGCSVSPTPPLECSSPTAVVGAGPEFELDLLPPFSTSVFSVDLGASSVRIENIVANTTLFVPQFNPLTLSSLDAGGPIIGIANLVVSDVTVFSASSVAWTADSLQIDLGSDANWGVDSFVSFDLVLGPTAPIPEPSSIALAALALAGLGLSRRRAAR
jgi:PEP-CTERM motif